MRTSSASRAPTSVGVTEERTQNSPQNAEASAATKVGSVLAFSPTATANVALGTPTPTPPLPPS